MGEYDLWSNDWDFVGFLTAFVWGISNNDGFRTADVFVCQKVSTVFSFVLFGTAFGPKD